MINIRRKTEEQFQKEIGDDYEILSSYINSRSKIKLKHVVCNTIFSVTPDSFFAYKESHCPYCFAKSSKNWDNTILKRKVSELTDDEYTAINFIKKDNFTKKYFIIKHNKCGNEYQITVHDFFKENGNRCPYCNGNKKKTDLEFKKEVKELVGNEYTFLDSYVNNATKIRVKHNVCDNVYPVAPKKFLQGRRCPHCAKAKENSKLTDAIDNYLNSHNINYKKEVYIDGCEYKRKLYFDYEILDKNNKRLFLLEADGIQHEKPTFSEKSFMEQQYRDHIKNDFCKEANIKLKRITYKQIKKIEDILDNYINDESSTTIERK